VSDPEEQDLPFQRSSIGAIGARRRWSLFGWGKNEDDGAGSAASRSGSDDGPPVHSMLGDLAAEAAPLSSVESDSDDRLPIHSMLGDLAAESASSFLAEEDVDDGPPVHSMLGDLAAQSGPSPEPETAGRSMLSLGSPSAGPVAGGDLIGPLTQHSTIAEIGGLEEHTSSTFPIERGVLISLVAHVALILLLLFLPTRIPAGSKGDLFAMLQPEPRDQTPIPVILDAPGPARPNPKRAPLSDADRRAGGGDKSRPKSDTPFVPPSSGVAGLAPGPRAPRVAGSQSPSRPAAPAQAAQQAAADRARAGEKSDQKPSEFPNQARPQGDGPREIGKLANLNSAIQAAAQETARGALSGGEGGAPAGNPDGGFVDSGPLSFDTKWYDWGAYAAEMIRRIKLHWDVPELARLGWKGSLTVRFYIMADGRVADAKIVRFSGIPPFDNAALQAIVKSSPFRPLPSDLHEEREGITITFFYNMRPESEEGKAQE